MKDEIFIKGNKDTKINGWKLCRYINYPSYEKPHFIYHLAYWKNGKVVEDTEEFIANKTIAIDYYNNVNN